MLSLVCQDRTGIIRDITRVLAAAHVNIEELNTTVLNGSFSGEAMFQAEARLRLPAGFDIDDLRRDLERLENDLMVDVRPAEPVAEVV
jgi:glycine cleavage system regulatory protein